MALTAHLLLPAVLLSTPTHARVRRLPQRRVLSAAAGDAADATAVPTPGPAVGQVDAAAASAKAALNNLLWNGPRRAPRRRPVAQSASQAAAAPVSKTFELLPLLLKLAKDFLPLLLKLAKDLYAALVFCVLNGGEAASVALASFKAFLSALKRDAPGKMELVGAALVKLYLGIRLWLAALAVLMILPCTAAALHGSVQRAQAEAQAIALAQAAKSKVKGAKAPTASAKAAAATANRR
jgi:hypothetical protein